MSNSKPQLPGQIEYLREEVHRLGTAINAAPNAAYHRYVDLQSEVNQLERAPADLNSPIDADIQNEIRISAIRRRMAQLEPAYRAGESARSVLFAELTAAQDALKMAELNLARGQLYLDLFDQDTRRWEAMRNYQRSIMAADLGRLTGKQSTVLPYPQLDKIL
jgi:multidrug efflux pump subunit AcrA (membrane-fusion protein)